MKLALMEVLSKDEIAAIHEASLDILSNTGVKVLHSGMLALLKERGLPVDTPSQCVRFPKSVIEDALASIPPQFEMYDRDGHSAFMLGDGTPRVAAGHNAVFWVDSNTGITRPSTVADVEQFAHLCEVLPGIDMIGIPVMPQDVSDPGSTLLHGVRACIANSRKPIFFSTDSARVNGAVMDMLAAVFPGNLAEQPCGISQLSPTSPLFWEGSVIDALMDTVRRGTPLAILPEPNAGVSAPYTLAGLLTVNNAECLSGLVMTQLLRPGAKVMYANSWTTTDMRTGYALVGSVETSLCRIAGAQLARFYGVPSHTTAPNSDNHAHDEQNAWEKTISALAAVAAGNDLIVNCGMFATGMTCSHEQLLMDEEISNMVRRMSRGIEVSTDTVARDLIAEIGLGSPDYLTAEHTLEHLRSREYFTPRLAVRGPRALWEAAGARDSYQLARAQVRDLAAAPGAPLEEKRRDALEEILSGFTVL
jgi:trimethylamine--corrinoid protein Co-methyltransferase